MTGKLRKATDFHRANYNEIIKKMISIMNHQDPMTLIKVGAPEDEYDTEVEIIYDYLFGSGRKIELEELISFSNWVFNYRFSGTRFRWDENQRLELFCQEVYNTFIESITEVE